MRFIAILSYSICLFDSPVVLINYTVIVAYTLQISTC